MKQGTLPISTKKGIDSNRGNDLVRIITPTQSRSIWASLREVIKYRELLSQITLREIKVRYKQTALGVAWAILQPLSLMVIFTLFFGRFAKIPSEGIPYPIFYYSALLPWQLFATSLSFAIPSLVTNRQLVTKIYFPREIFPLSSILAALVDFTIGFFIFLIMIFIYKIAFTTCFLLVIPILFIQIIFILGISFFASAINVYYRDVRYALPLIIQLWLFISPVIYPVSIIPKYLRTIYLLNPMAGIIDGYRSVLGKGIPPDSFGLGLAAVMSVMLFFFGYRYFKKIEMSFADVI